MKPLPELFKEVDEALNEGAGMTAVYPHWYGVGQHLMAARAALREIAERWPHAHDGKIGATIHGEILNENERAAILAALEEEK